MNIQILLGVATLFVAIRPIHANPESRRATITGGGGNGRCTVEVSVDHAAEVEIAGDTGWLTTVAGQPAQWRRFQCNTPLPPKSPGFPLHQDQRQGASPADAGSAQHGRQSRGQHQRPARGPRKLHFRSSMGRKQRRLDSGCSGSIARSWTRSRRLPDGAGDSKLSGCRQRTAQSGWLFLSRL